MKKIILFAIGMLLLCLTGIAQNADSIIENATQLSLTEGAKLFIGLLNFTYIIVFSITAWLVNDTTDSVNIGGKMNWLQRIPKLWRTVVIGLLWAFIFYWGFRYNTRLDVISMLFSLLVGLLIYKIGIKRVFKWISVRWFGFRFQES